MPVDIVSARQLARQGRYHNASLGRSIRAETVLGPGRKENGALQAIAIAKRTPTRVAAAAATTGSAVAGLHYLAYYL